MDGLGDYFAAPASGVRTPPVRVESPLLPVVVPPRGRRATLVAAATGGCLLALVAGGVLRTGGSARSRPITIPAELGGLPLVTNQLAAQQREAFRPVLRKIYGGNAAVSARYERSPGIVALVAGRASVEHGKAGDARQTSPGERVQYDGGITCAPMQIGKHAIASIHICWYSTRTFGASLLASQGQYAGPADQAAALAAAIPLMRDGPPEK